MEDMDGRAASLAAAEALGDYQLLDREFQQLAGASAAEVRRAAADVLDPGAVSAVAYLPRDRGADLTSEQLARVFAADGRRDAEGGAARSVAAPPAVVARRTSAGVGGVRPAMVMAEVHQAALPGVDLLVRRKPGVPLVSLGVYLPRVQFDPPGQAGVSALAVRCAIRGAGGLDAAGLAFAFERLGGTLASSVTLDWLGFGTSVLSSNLEPASRLLNLVLTAPRYLEAQVEAERRLLVEETTQVADDMFRYPFQLAFGAAFGDEGYGIPSLGLPTDLAGLTRAQVQDWYRIALVRPRAVVVAVGDLDAEAAMRVLADSFADGPARVSAPLDQPVAWRVGRHSDPRVSTREKAQSAFALAFPGPSRRDPTRYAAEVWSAVASGLGGRLFEALRDRRSLAYTVMASSWQKARSGAFVAYIATAPEREQEARQEMLAELSRFAAERVTPEELAQATSYLAGQIEVQRQRGSAVAGEVLEAWLAGQGLSDLVGTADRYRAVTAEEVRAVAERALGDGAWHAEGIVRGTGGGR
jgi:zinc protease